MVSNIKTHYGKFPTLTHFERYWGDRVSEAFRNGFDKGYRYFKKELHKTHKISKSKED